MNDNTNDQKLKSSSRIDTLYLWALSLGLAVGWGAFVIPGSTFFPLAGPVGTIIGFAAGAVIMLAIAACYKYMIVLYPINGGAYAFTRELLGFDHAFLASWSLILAYMSILWANSTAFVLIGRYLAAPYIQWGFHYTVAGYDVYLSEILITMAILLLFALLSVLDNKCGRIIYIIISAFVLIASAILFFGGCSASGMTENYLPAFSEVSYAPIVQIFNIVIFAPWAYVGFEGISHPVNKVSVKPKSYFGIMALALLSAALIYIFMSGVSLLAIPEGFSSWTDYIGEGTGGMIIRHFPVYFSVSETLGSTGLFILITAMVAALSTSLIGYYRILANLISSMAEDGLLSKRFTQTNKHGVHVKAIRAVMLISVIMPFLGRVTISWIIDVTTISVSIVYCYTSICTFISARKRRDLKYKLLGIFGMIISVLFFIFPIIPNPFTENTLSTRSYILLVGWGMFGLMFYWLLFRKDKQSRFGHSMIMWMLMLFLIIFTALIWFQQTVSALGDTTTASAQAKINFITATVFILILLGLLITYSIFTILRKRSYDSEIRRIQAEERSKAKTIFLSNMSHDIRTPMNAIIGYTALARDPGTSPEKTADYLNKIDSSSKHLLELINDILEMSSIEVGKLNLNEDVTDIRRLVLDAGDMFRQQMESNGIHFSVDVSNVRNTLIVCDKTKMTRVLLNLISNAYKFTPEDGTVSVVLREKDHSGRDNTASFVLSVKDNGIGMSEEFAKHVFDAFEREKNSTVSRTEGTGLGMAITKGIIDMMGGKISVRSKQSVGTEFTIELRLKLAGEAMTGKDQADQTAGALQSGSLPDEAPFKGLKALLVDDMDINREMAKKILTKLGFEVTTASDGQEAVEQVVNTAPGDLDIILMDVQMPVMNGYEATAKIRELSDDKLASIPIIAITANAFESDVKTALDAGMNGHISKPLIIPDMVAEIKRVLGL